LLTVLTKRSPYFNQALNQRVVSNCRVGPDSREQLVLTNQSTIVLDKMFEGVERLGAQLDLFTITKQTATREIERELIKDEFLL